MTNEIKNDTNNQDTVEQNQNGAAELAATDQPAPVPTSEDPSGVSDPTNNPTIPLSINPLPGASNPAEAEPSATHPPIQQSIHPTVNPSVSSDSATQTDPAAMAPTTPGQSGTVVSAHKLITQSEPFADRCIAGAELVRDSEELADHCCLTAEPEAQHCEVSEIGPNLSKASPRGPNRIRRGRIASLPPDLRLWVNEQLVLQTPAGQIIAYLAEQGHPGISEKNVSNWRIGGFQDYLKQTENAVEREKRWKSLLSMAREQGSSFDIAALQLGIGHFHQVLDVIAPAHVARFVTSKPEHFFKLNVGLSNLMKAYVALCRLKKNPESCRLTSVKPAAHTGWEREKDGGLTEEERDAVARDLGIFPPPDMFPMPAKPQPAPVTEKEP